MNNGACTFNVKQNSIFVIMKTEQMMNPLNSCTLESGLTPYEPGGSNPWDARKVRHVMRRLGFGATPELIDQALQQHPVNWVDGLLAQAQQAPRPAQPLWANRRLSEYSDFQTEIQAQILEWGLTMIDDFMSNSLRASLNLFWSNHFVTRLEAYACPSWMYQYWKVLDDHCFGNFQQFVKAVGTTPAMLVFLNGVQNTRLEPNENYARELFELFTLGRDQGYTQNDITNAARALTGWNLFTELCAPINFLAILHDPGLKTIFGKTGNYNFDTLHDLLFQERSLFIARFICKKLYRAYISPEPDPNFINALSEVMIQNQFDLLPVYRALFTSERFFDPLVEGVLIKSPLDYYLSLVHETGVSLNQELKTLILLQAGENGQFLLNPPDVAGWPGNRDWISTSKLTQRWLATDFFLYYLFINQPETLTELPTRLSGSLDDPSEITADIINYYLPSGLQNSADYEQAIQIFKWEVPENYYQSKEWNVYWSTVGPQVAFLMQHMVRIPEFQLK
jgi:uncharacterized protein (DUF1800 family)